MSKRGFYFLLLAVVVFTLDALLKAYVKESLPLVGAHATHFPFGGIKVFANWHGIDFALVHVANKGVAWGLLASFQEYVLYVRVLIIGALLSYLVFVETPNFRKFCLTLIFAGACGNVLDYFLYGHVIDMFYFIFFGYSYPVFNLADAAIFSGVVLLLMQGLFGRRKSKEQTSAA